MTIPEPFTETLQELLEQNRELRRELRDLLNKSQNKFSIDRDFLEKVNFQMRALAVLATSSQHQISSMVRQFETLDRPYPITYIQQKIEKGSS